MRGMVGARGGSRTPTGFRPLDPKSSASANFATLASPDYRTVARHDYPRTAATLRRTCPPARLARASARPREIHGLGLVTRHPHRYLQGGRHSRTQCLVASSRLFGRGGAITLA